MATDEVLLASAEEAELPLLRFYGWTEPAASFGYSQAYQAVAAGTPLRPLVRRPTGGGLVPHDRDWTYSLVFPPEDPWYSLKATASYQRVHRWIDRAFHQLSIPTALAPNQASGLPGQCFVGAEKDDLLWQNRKIAGAAQRRNRQGLLIQGSVQPTLLPQVTREEWEQAMLGVASREWGVQWTPTQLTAAQERRIADLARNKYSADSFNQRR